MSDSRLSRAADLVRLEGWFLDNRDWDAWLNLYARTATYWLPCWLDEDNYTSDPNRQMSLIYYPNRNGLEDRVFRIRTDQSLASLPLPRTCHITSVITTALEEDNIVVQSNWVVYSYKLGKQHNFFGQQRHTFETDGQDLKIVSRKIILANDIIPNVLDIYSI
jgi:3-phenylpropionate/cinnamic acid dioxygenase small subunit|tara:strand:+ start:11524 stop:12012 length:489 start_codon:yes stop_codon:yes gene_type:complete